MTFRSLYRLEQRGLLDCPIVGVAVDDWTIDQLGERARDSIIGTGEQLDAGGLRSLRDPALLRRRRLRRRGHLRARRGRDQRCGDAGVLPRDPAVPVRHGRQGPARSRADDERPRRRREAVRPRPRLGHRAGRRAAPVRSTSRSSTASTTTSGRWGSRRSCTCASRTPCSSRSGTATTSMRPDHDGRELRRRGPRPLLRPGRRAARRRRQPPHAGRRRGRDGGASRRRPGDAQGRAGSPSSAPSRPPTRRTTSAASTTATATSTASPPTRPPRPTPRCGSTSRTGAGRACRSSSAPASACR